MRSTSTPRLLMLTLALVAGFVASSFAQTPEAGQAPPPEPDKGTTSQLKCIGSDTGYKGSGKTLAYVTTLSNKCEARLKCRLFVHAVNAKGSTLGRATLVLAPVSKGEAAKKSYAMKVRMAGGMTMSTRECRAI